MRTRNIKLFNYGIGREEEKRLRALAKEEENAVLVRVAAEESNQGIADALFMFLVYGVGFRRLPEELMIIGEDDFYAYRRKALYIFKILLRGRKTENMSGGKDKLYGGKLR